MALELWRGGGRQEHIWTLQTLLLADRLLSLTLLAFESLNTATSKDRCLACIEEPFFSPLWPLLLALYRYAAAWLTMPMAGAAILVSNGLSDPEAILGRCKFAGG